MRSTLSYPEMRVLYSSVLSMGMINPPLIEGETTTGRLPRDESPVFLCLEHGDDKSSAHGEGKPPLNAYPEMRVLYSSVLSMGMINPPLMEGETSTGLLPRDESPVFFCLEHGDDKASAHRGGNHHWTLTQR